jgi:hypothetical protein
MRSIELGGSWKENISQYALNIYTFTSRKPKTLKVLLAKVRGSRWDAFLFIYYYYFKLLDNEMVEKDINF